MIYRRRSSRTLALAERQAATIATLTDSLLRLVDRMGDDRDTIGELAGATNRQNDDTADLRDEVHELGKRVDSLELVADAHEERAA
jgi:hypothetical protein